MYSPTIKHHYKVPYLTYKYTYVLPDSAQFKVFDRFSIQRPTHVLVYVPTMVITFYDNDIILHLTSFGDDRIVDE